MATISGAALQQASATPTLSTKPLPPPLKKPSAPTAPRIDLEPLYSALKAAIGDNWPVYKEACALYLSGAYTFTLSYPLNCPSQLTIHTGQLNQEELSRRIDPIICTDPSREHLHNQLICAIYANTLRDAPEPGVASWVSASDKVTASSKAVTGDAAEQRLKIDIMQLPPRERHRLKQLHDDHADWLNATIREGQKARDMIKLPDIGSASAGGGGYNKTSKSMRMPMLRLIRCVDGGGETLRTNAVADWEIEIHKRYAQPLYVETHEFPETDTVSARIMPICYEEGLVAGAAPGCAEFVNVAAEAYVKELLADIFMRVRSNGVNYVQTAAFRKRLAREEAAFERAEVKRNAVGLLPCEAEVGAKRKPISLNDLRMCCTLGNSALSQIRLVSDRIMVGDFVDDEDDEGLFEEIERGTGAKMNGVAAPMTNGTHDHDGDTNMTGMDGEILGDWSWVGGAVGDREQLGGVLEDCLAVGQ